ncbi:MAG: aminotransferase class V-fold PLP-dependent enzyme [Lachnospiraceae bacterium]|nr:aminotransferase class V-fold PLP-dependent enzyme [Lachnospiraceae bacterium]
MKSEETSKEYCPLWFDIEKLKENQKQTIYMDNAATTYHKPKGVYDAMNEVNRCLSVNAGRGSYQLAQIAVEGMDKLREELLNLINGHNRAEVVFTPSATIAFNQIIGGLMLNSQNRVYVSPFEHNAVMRTLNLWQKRCGFSIEILPMDVKKMEIDLEKTEYMFREKTPTHIFVTQVSNVTGYILPVSEIYHMAKEITEGQAIVIIDGAQSFGLVNIDYQRTPYDGIVFAGHKTLYGPFGIAGFIKGKALDIEPCLAGGTGSNSLAVDMPESIVGLEPSSPNIVGIAGLYAAVQFINEKTVDTIYQYEKKLTEELRKCLKNIPGVILYLPKDLEHQIGIVSFNVRGYRADELGMILDEDYHIAVRTGYHCAPLVHDYLNDKEFGGTVRAAVSYFNKIEDIEALEQAISELAEGA